MRKYLLTGALIAISTLTGFVLVRAWSGHQEKRQFEPYTITSYEDRVYDDGRVEHRMRFTIHTASDGGVREIRTPINPDGTEGQNVLEQLIKPYSGTYFIYHGIRVISTFRKSDAPIRRETPEAFKSRPGFHSEKRLLNKFTVYCTKIIDSHGAAETCSAPEFGLVVLEYRFRPADANHTIVRSVTDISPGDDKNVEAHYEGYRRETMETSPSTVKNSSRP